MGCKQQLVITGGFVPPADDARYFLADEGRWTTYGEMVAGIDPECLPRDEDGLRLLLTAMGALSVEDMRTARDLYEALLWALAAGIREDVPEGFSDRTFEEAFPELHEVLARRGSTVMEEVLARMVSELGEGATGDAR